MIGRGIDQVLPHSVEPRLHEPHVNSAETYVRLAERVSGKIPRRVQPSYVWGAALDELRQLRPAVRIINLETAVTTSNDRWPGKDVLYRTHPANVAILKAAGIDCCVLANNHTLDWGTRGLLETLRGLRAAGIATVGAGQKDVDAMRPAVFDVAGGRVIVVGLGSPTSGIPIDWAATSSSPGVNLATGPAEATAAAVAAQLKPVRRPADIVVVSIHWGANWGYDVAGAQRHLARQLIDIAEVDIVHGHSSHHPRPIEIYRDRLILYGCGDLMNDYEGISGYEAFRDDLVLAYFPIIEPGTGRLGDLTMTPYRIRRFQLVRAEPTDVAWLQERLDAVSREYGTRVETTKNGRLRASPL